MHMQPDPGNKEEYSVRTVQVIPIRVLASTVANVRSYCTSIYSTTPLPDSPVSFLENDVVNNVRTKCGQKLNRTF